MKAYVTGDCHTASVPPLTKYRISIHASHHISMTRIYSETLGVCVVDNIVPLAASKREKAVPYYVLKPVFEDKVSYIPVEHHRVVLRDMFTREEALKLKETEQYEKDKHLMQAVDYVLDKVAIK